MEATASAKRVRAGGGVAGDRLSSLSDDLLHHVMSFVPAQQAVQTTVLSKRWTDLWRSVPGINLDFKDFPDGTEEDRWRKMEDFTANLLMRHRAPRLDLFLLRMSCVSATIKVDCLRDVARWIRRAVEYRPSVLKVQLPPTYRYRYQFPHLSSCELKRLELSDVSLDSSFTEQLHCRCPVMEDLVLAKCSNVGAIQSGKLKSLAVLYCDLLEYKLAIRASFLTSLRLSAVSIHEDRVSLDVGNSLVTAKISVGLRLSPRTGAMLLSCLSNVTTLELHGFSAMEMLDKELHELPTFDNLRTMSLRFCVIENHDVDKFKTHCRFLHKSPNLEKLTLKNFWVASVVESDDFSMLTNLRTLFLHMCNINDNFGLLNHCLRNSPNLEKLTIGYRKLPDGSNGRDGNATYSQSSNQQACFQCPELKSTEIISCYNRADVPGLLRFLLDIAAPKNTITFSKV